MRIHVACIVVLLPLAALAGTIEQSQHLELSITDVTILQIACGAGLLEVYGVDGTDRISVTATVIISGIPPNRLPGYLDQHVLLSLNKQSHKAVLKSVFKNQNRMKADAKIELTVAVPKSLRLQINDGSGWIDVSDLDANLDIKDGSGSIKIRDVQGNVGIEDGSGKIQIVDISGNLKVKDGSGSIQVDRIKGNVRLVDSSGDILIKDIDGNLTIRDGSGGIEIMHVSRNVLIKEAGSGSVEIDGVTGKVTTWE